MARFYNDKQVIACILTALAVNFIIEILSRHSLFGAVSHLVKNPWAFCFNTSIIFMTLTIAFLFKRKNFFIMIISFLWCSLGIINCALLFFRVTPLSLMDFYIAETAMPMIMVYLSTFQMILLGLWIIAIIVCAVLAWKKFPKKRMRFPHALITIMVSIVVVIIGNTVTNALAVKNQTFAVLTNAYDKVGFAYCFSRSIFDDGIDKPGEYSENEVKNVLNSIKTEPRAEAVLPNIIVLQLESFFDVSHLKNYTVSSDPTPTFNALKANNPNGVLTVPSMGGGTANTEFEFLTGMNLDYFGVGQYPYQTILKTTPAESMARVLKDKGYLTTALHNHTAMFYKRHLAYANLGFDKFTPVEYMDIVERTELGWAKDVILKSEIERAITSTEDRDFVFTVTMQGHGKYPTEELQYNKLITVDRKPDYIVDPEETEEEEALKTGLEYYVNQLYETDVILSEIIEMLKNYPEPVALLVYGDHLPAFDITVDDLTGFESVYQTEYALWTNYKELPYAQENVYTYELGRVLFDYLELNGGLFINAGRTLEGDEYQQALEILAYDMFYGGHYSLPADFSASNMQFGIDPITISHTETLDDGYTYIYGKGFTKYSKVFINGEKISTKRLDWNTLRVKTENIVTEEGCEMYIAQINGNGAMISKTDSVWLDAMAVISS